MNVVGDFARTENVNLASCGSSFWSSSRMLLSLLEAEGCTLLPMSAALGRGAGAIGRAGRLRAPIFERDSCRCVSLLEGGHGLRVLREQGQFVAALAPRELCRRKVDALDHEACDLIQARALQDARIILGMDAEEIDVSSLGEGVQLEGLRLARSELRDA